MSRSKVILLWVLLICCMDVLAAEPETLQEMIRASKTRSDMVSAARQAVVHIEVEKVIEKRDPMVFFNDPFGLFDDRFFDQFFGRRPQPDQPNPRKREFRQEGFGSGTIIDRDGTILTNNHVVGETDKIKVKLMDGREFEAELVGTDPLADIAVIKINGKDLPHLEMADSDEIQVGETVIAIGNPFGLSHTVTMGIVSAKGRSNVGIAAYEDFIQTDAAINPGNSGGPLINLEGKVVGINTAIFTRTGGYQGIGLSVPSNMAKEIMKELIDQGSVSRGWLGVTIQDVTSDLAAQFGLSEAKGALVSSVMSESPAAAAGIKQGDVILRLKEKPIRDSSHLRNQVGMCRPGTRIPLEILRNRTKQTVTVKMGLRPDAEELLANTRDADTVFGMSVRDLTADLADRMGLSFDHGVVVTAVEPGSPAHQAGIRPGSVIQEMNRQKIDDTAALMKAAKNADLSEGVLVLIRTARGTNFVVLKTN